MNFNSNSIDEYDEIVSKFHCKSSYNHVSNNIDLNIKNRNAPLARPSIEEPSIYELKAPISLAI